jgi:hypothetical protein
MKSDQGGAGNENRYSGPRTSNWLFISQQALLVESSPQRVPVVNRMSESRDEHERHYATSLSRFRSVRGRQGQFTFHRLLRLLADPVLRSTVYPSMLLEGTAERRLWISSPSHVWDGRLLEYSHAGTIAWRTATLFIILAGAVCCPISIDRRQHDHQKVRCCGALAVSLDGELNDEFRRHICVIHAGR